MQYRKYCVSGSPTPAPPSGLDLATVSASNKEEKNSTGVARCSALVACWRRGSLPFTLVAGDCSVDPSDDCSVDPSDDCSVGLSDDCSVGLSDDYSVDPSDDCSVGLSDDCSVDPSDDCSVDPSDDCTRGSLNLTFFTGN